MLTRDLTSEVLPQFRAGLIAICIAVAAYALAPVITHALSLHAVELAKSLLVAPVVEELFFRGVVQSRLRAQPGLLGRPWSAIGLTAACFALAHLATASAGSCGPGDRARTRHRLGLRAHALDRSLHRAAQRGQRNLDLFLEHLK